MIQIPACFRQVECVADPGQSQSNDSPVEDSQQLQTAEDEDR